MEVFRRKRNCGTYSYNLYMEQSELPYCYGVLFMNFHVKNGNDCSISTTKDYINIISKNVSDSTAFVKFILSETSERKGQINFINNKGEEKSHAVIPRKYAFDIGCRTLKGEKTIDEVRDYYDSNKNEASSFLSEIKYIFSFYEYITVMDNICENAHRFSKWMNERDCIDSFFCNMITEKESKYKINNKQELIQRIKFFKSKDNIGNPNLENIHSKYKKTNKFRNKNFEFPNNSQTIKN